MSRENNGQPEDNLPALPSGWCWARVGELGEVRLGRQRSPKNRSEQHPTKYIRAANITWNGLDLSDVLDMEFKPAELGTYRLLPGDVLLSEASGSPGEVGKPAIWRGEIEDCCFQNTVIRFRPIAMPPDFPFVVFSHFARNGVFSTAGKGVGIHHLSADRFSTLAMPLAPLNEQRRIVAKIEELFSDLDAGVAALVRIRANLKRYRAAVLKTAVEGRLTEEWRAKHPKTEPASKLLERILAERRQKWEENQLAKFAAAGKTPPKGWREKYVEPAGPGTSGLPELPQGWCWATVEQITENHDGARIPVKAKDRKKKQGPYPYYGASGIIDHVDGFLFNGDYLLIAEDGANLLSRSTPIAFRASGRFWVNNHAHVVTTHGAIPLNYVELFFNATRFDFVITGTAQPKLTQAALNRIALPLPPLPEQEQIVAEVDRLLSIVEESEAQVETNLKRTARLRQSILKRAFEGRLVPQDPTDEPADKLLERIRQQREAGKMEAGRNGPTRRTGGKAKAPTKKRD